MAQQAVPSLKASLPVAASSCTMHASLQLFSAQSAAEGIAGHALKSCPGFWLSNQTESKGAPASMAALQFPDKHLI